MESVVGAVAIQKRLTRIGHLIIVVAQLVMDGGEVFLVDFDAHLQADIFFEVDVPGAGVTDDVAVRGLNEKRAIPECRRQRIETERLEKRFTIPNQLLRLSLTAFQNLRQVVTTIAAALGFEQRINVSPLLRPHVSQQVSGNRPVGRHDLFAILF